jgi:hypothetical protein
MCFVWQGSDGCSRAEFYLFIGLIVIRACLNLALWRQPSGPPGEPITDMQVSDMYDKSHQDDHTNRALPRRRRPEPTASPPLQCPQRYGIIPLYHILSTTPPPPPSVGWVRLPPPPCTWSRRPPRPRSPPPRPPPRAPLASERGIPEPEGLAAGDQTGGWEAGGGAGSVDSRAAQPALRRHYNSPEHPGRADCRLSRAGIVWERAEEGHLVVGPEHTFHL